MAPVLFETLELKKHFAVNRRLFAPRDNGSIKAVDGVSFSIREGEIFGLVGESGSGKTTVGRLLLLLEEPSSGSILFDGKNIHSFSARDLAGYRRSVQAVFQDPSASLNPRMRAGSIVAEPLVVNKIGSRKSIKARAAELLDLVGLGKDSGSLYPHEFSGGQRQRIAVARALATNPRFIVLDEPVSALDVSIRAQILNLLKELQEKFSLAYLLIGHDLAVVQHMSNRVGVMYMGKLVELAGSEELYAHPLHPYTVALLSAVLPMQPDERTQEIATSGEVPSALKPPPGCRFHPRCPHAKPVCAEVEPKLEKVGADHMVACHLYSES